MPANEAPLANDVTPVSQPAASAPPAKPAEAPERKQRRSGLRWRLLLVAVVVAALWALYTLSLQFVAYTSDAFVATDVLQVAPQVGGRIAALHVADNQFVRKGELLIEIDPTPYALQVALREADLAKAEADVQTAIRDVGRARAELSTRQESLGLARRTERRFAVLVGKQAASQLAFDEASTKMREAEREVRASEASLEALQQEVEASKAATGVARQALKLARWNLSQTRLLAPIDGYVNNMWLRVGDYALAGEPRLAIVASDRWRVVALYKEEAIRHLAEGGPVWIQLDIYPWRLFRGHIQGVTRGISRELRQTALLPDIAPTTGWIRFQRRFPVRILLDPVPDDVRLHVGANARTLAIYGW